MKRASRRALYRTGASRWHLKRAVVTGCASATVAALIGAFLHGGVLLTVLASTLTGLLVGALAGYRPIQEPDSDRAEEELLGHWVGD